MSTLWGGEKAHHHVLECISNMVSAHPETLAAELKENLVSIDTHIDLVTIICQHLKCSGQCIMDLTGHPGVGSF